MTGHPQSVHKFIDGYKGMLWRKSQMNGAWKQRYFVLESKKLRCYEDSTCAKLTSEIVIFADINLYDMPDSTAENRNNLFYFSGSNADDVYYLSADTEEEKKNWLEALTDSHHNGFKLMDQPALGIEPFYPTVDLCLSYADHTCHANNSNKFKPLNVKDAPSVVLRFGHDHNIYSLIMIDIDAVGLPKENKTSYLHWAIVNIEGTDVSSGLEIAHYESPAPDYNSGFHRYMFLLFDQASDFTPDQFDELDEMFAHRDQFSHLELMRRFHLGTPVGINGFYSAWDETCDALHAERGYTPHADNFSPLQAARAASDRAERARQVLFKDFVLSDLFPADEVDPSVQLPLGTIALEVVYEDEHVCEDGEMILPARTVHEPEVSYTPHPIGVDARGAPECGLYTLLLVDPDAPSRIHHEMRENVKWAVMNIPQDKVTEGEYVLTYLTPAPAYASGLHRYIFCLYKQKRAFTLAELDTTREHFSKRSGIHTYEWVRSQEDVLHNVPVGVEAFLSEWDASVDEVHKALGYMPPPQHRSPAQKRAMLAEEASKPSAKPVFTPAGGEADQIMERLKKIQEAHHAFNTTVTGNTSILTNLDAATKANKATAIEDATTGPVYMTQPEADNKAAVVPASKPKVAPRAPITLSGSSKVISSTGASASLDISIQDESSSAAAATAALLNSSASDAVMQQETTRQESSKSAVASAHRATHKSEQNSTATVHTMHQQQRSDGHFTEERTEEVTEEKREDTTENLTEDLTESFNQSQAGQRTAFSATSMEATNSAASMLAEEQRAQEVVRQQQQQQVQQRQQELLERQRQEMELQESARQAQQAKILKQQQETLERQKAQEQERIRQAELGSAPQQPHHRGARKQKSREFFSAIPDSEYSDTDASAFDNGSVFSASPVPNRYGYLQTQNSNSSYGGPVTDGIGAGRPQMVPEGDDSRSEYSDTSGASSLARPSRSSDENTSGAKRSPKPVDATARLKQIQDGVLQAKSSNQLCDLFGVTTPTIFTGEKMKKKMSNDFLSKDSFLWINPRSRTLHWSKNKADATDSKYLLLHPLGASDPGGAAKGELKGTVKRVRVSGPNVLVTLESGEFMELKLSAEGAPPAIKRATDWAAVIKAFSPSA